MPAAATFPVLPDSDARMSSIVSSLVALITTPLSAVNFAPAPSAAWVLLLVTIAAAVPPAATPAPTPTDAEIKVIFAMLSAEIRTSPPPVSCSPPAVAPLSSRAPAHTLFPDTITLMPPPIDGPFPVDAAAAIVTAQVSDAAFASTVRFPLAEIFAPAPIEARTTSLSASAAMLTPTPALPVVAATAPPMSRETVSLDASMSKSPFDSAITAPSPTSATVSLSVNSIATEPASAALASALPTTEPAMDST